MTYEKCHKLESDTREQSGSKLWQEERRIRFTSSQFYMICHRQLFNENFQKLITGTDVRAAPMEHGKYNEGIARSLYIKKTNNKVFKNGLIVHPLAPHLGASPDGIIYNNEEGYGVLEIKCPYSKKYN